MFGIKVIANGIYDETGKEISGYWDGSKDNLLNNLKPNSLYEGVKSFDTYEEVSDECLNLNIEYEYDFEIVTLNALGFDVDLNDEVATKWNCVFEVYEYEKHYKHNGYVKIDKVKEEVYNSISSHSSKEGYPYVTRKLVERLTPSKEEIYKESLKLVESFSKGKKITTKYCTTLNYGIMAAKIMKDNILKEKDKFLEDASDIYLPKYIDKVVKEFDEKCEVFDKNIASFRKTIIDYNNYLLPIKIKSITEAENKKIAMRTLTGICTCKTPIDIKYHKNYCGSCGKKINWDEIYRKSLS